MTQVYDFSLNSLHGEPINFSSFKGKVILLVNTASKCGFTPQYEDLEAIHTRYKDEGLVVIGVPCNQFGHQEPGDAQSIAEGCLSDYGVDFLITEKLDVNGAKRHPLFSYLCDALPGVLSNNIKWNFTKFLIGRDGKPLQRFAPITHPKKLEKYLKQALGVG